MSPRVSAGRARYAVHKTVRGEPCSEVSLGRRLYALCAHAPDAEEPGHSVGAPSSSPSSYGQNMDVKITCADVHRVARRRSDARGGAPAALL